MKEERRNLPSKEAEGQRGGKQARVVQTRSSSEGAITDRRGDHQTEVLAWTPSIVLNGALLPSDASIRDFQQGEAGYVANAVEQALLLPTDMANLRSMRKHEVFLSLKRDLTMVSHFVPFSHSSTSSSSSSSSSFLFYFILFFFTIVFPSLIGYSSYI